MHARAGRPTAWLIGCCLAAATLAAADLRLVDVVKAGDIEAARGLLRQGISVNSPEADGTTALHWASHRSNLEMIQLLLDAGADVNSVNDLGVTPVALASANRNPAVVGRLLDAGANPNLASVTGITPLMNAVRTGDLESVARLLSHRADVNARESARGQTALMWAVARRQPQIVRLLLEHGADVRARARIVDRMVMFEEYEAGLGADRTAVPTSRTVGSTIQVGGSTPLLFAATSGDLESSRLLLSAGADVNDAAPDGHSALVIAIHNGYGRLGALLLEYGADPNWSAGGFAPLHAAALRSDRDMVKALLDRGANPNARLTRGTPGRRYGTEWALPTVELTGATPFFIAAAFLDTDIMSVLAARGADPNLGVSDGTTPLMAAVGVRPWLSRPSIGPRDVAILDPITGNIYRPGDREDRVFEAAKLLLTSGADVSAANGTGDTALHGAAAQGFVRVVRMLAGSGAALEVKNTKGQTPLARGGVAARGARAQEVKDVLRELGARE